MEPQKIDRINELTRLSGQRALTSEEQAERAALRAEYIAQYRQSMAQTLEYVRIRQEDGTLTPLRKKGDAGPDA